MQCRSPVEVVESIIFPKGVDELDLVCIMPTFAAAAAGESGK